jgi:catechol 2,3-dioxygenase-like lactoylglutathione lyase family enzyme
LNNRAAVAVHADTTTADARPVMLRDHDSSAIVAVRDLGRARVFYSDVLGLELAAEARDGMPLVYRTGATVMTVYPSREAGSNRANAVCWGVGEDLDAIVAGLQASGVAFEHYPELGRLEGDVHVVARQGPGGADARLVWFKDPDGNILHLNNLELP